VLVREPLVENIFTTDFANSPLVSQRLPRAESGTYETVSVIDHTPRIIGYQAVPGLPLVVVLGYARADVLATWYRHVYTFGALTPWWCWSWCWAPSS